MAAIAAFNVAIANKTVTNLSNLQLANVEALAEKEDAFDYESMGCRTESCDERLLTVWEEPGGG